MVRNRSGSGGLPDIGEECGNASSVALLRPGSITHCAVPWGDGESQH